MRNQFFTAALKKSAALAGKPSRILQLVMQLGAKLRNVDWKTIKDQGIKEKLLVIGRFATAYANGNYRSVSLKSMLMIIAAIIYFVNPIDLIPDLMPLIGFTDDIGVLLWVYNALGSEIDKFIAWEKTQLA